MKSRVPLLDLKGAIALLILVVGTVAFALVPATHTTSLAASPKGSGGQGATTFKKLLPEKRAKVPVLGFFDASVNTDRDDYSPGQLVHISGAGFQANETVQLQVQYNPELSSKFARQASNDYASGHEPWFVVADDSGNFSADWLVEEDSAGQRLLLTADGMSSLAHAEKVFWDAASITLEQCHNFDGVIVNCQKLANNANHWGTGNAQQGSALLSEGDYQNFRAIMEDIPNGTYDLVIELDLTKQGKVAYDRFTSPGRIRTPLNTNGLAKATVASGATSPESLGIFPCSDATNAPNKWCTPPPNAPVPIPTVPAGVVNDTAFYNDMHASEAADQSGIFLYGAGSVGFAATPYTFSGSVSGDSSLQLHLKITKSGGTGDLVLAWGGHISKGADYTASGHTTATTISGSPYHMRLISFSALNGSPGNQDMQMAANAIVINTGAITIIKDAVPDDPTDFNFSITGPSPVPSPATFSLDDDGDNTLPNTTTYSNLANGTYSVQELGLPISGWTLDSIVCQDPVNPGQTTTNTGTGVASINLSAGEQVVCTYTNKKNARLKLVKTVTNDNGGTAAPNDWDLVATGSGGFTELTPAAADATFHNVTIGVNYSLSETGPSGYTQGNFSCDGGTTGTNTVQLAAGDSVTCTVNNNDNAPALHLRKVIVNDNGGTATLADFTLNASGGPTPISGTSPVDSGASFSAGTYALSETVSAGQTGKYSASAWVCVGGSQSGSNITVGIGQSATCTITNDDIAPQLHLRKVVVNDNGGTGTLADFTLNASGGPTPISGTSPVDSGASFTAGTYALSETVSAAQTGKYTASAWVCVGGSQSGSNITVGVAQSATCTITNDDIAPGLHLRKVVVNNNGGTAAVADFTLNASGGPTPISGTSPVDSGANFVAGTYALSETVSAAQTGKYSASAWVCVGGSQSGSNITVANGQSATCTITNDDIAPSLHLRKVVVNDNGGTAAVADFTLTATGPTGITGTSPVDSGATFSAGSYALSETVSAGQAGKYSASAWVCVGGSQSGSNITLANAESATCTITNNDIPPQLHLRKVVVNDNGGTGTLADFTLTGAGPTGISGTSPVDSGATFAAGTYALSETVSAGQAGKYSASAWVCVGGTQSGSNITVTNGESATCTITNNDIPPALHLRKVVVNDNGGTGTLADFTLTGAGPTGISGTSPVDSGATFAAGTYALSETVSAGQAGKYTASAWVCVGGTQSGSNITVANGQSATCTITNDDIAPQLHLRKVVVNNNGGTATVADFTLNANGGPTPISGTSPVDSGASFSAGTYALSETVSAAQTGKYSASAWVCVGGSQSGSNITLANAQSATCTITNDDIAPQLHLRKVVVNNNGGTATVADFTLNAGGGPTPISGTSPVDSGASFSAGTYALSETVSAAQAGKYAASAWVCVGGSQSGSNITVGVNESATCTITNDDIAPALHLRKVVINDNGGTKTTADFTLSASGPTSISGTSPVDSGSGFSAGTYALSESNVTGYAASAWVCTGTGSQVGSSITLANAQSATCTITNDDRPGTLIIRKFTDPANSPQLFTFNTSGTGYTGPFQISGVTSGGANVHSATLDVGSYTAMEDVPSGWTLTGIGTFGQAGTACSVSSNGGQGPGTSTGNGDLNTMTVTVDLKNGDTVTCDFENTGTLVTRTQGFWATHSALANAAWFGGTAGGHTFPGVANTPGIGDTLLCGRSIDSLAKLLAGFWSNIAKDCNGDRRSKIDQARMQLLQQLLAAELNASAFGSVPPGGSAKFAQWEAAFCGNNQSAIQTAQSQAAAFNESGDNGSFTPGTSADAKNAKTLAATEECFWNLPAGFSNPMDPGGKVDQTFTPILKQ
jgi:hypothetical protein